MLRRPIVFGVSSVLAMSTMVAGCDDASLPDPVPQDRQVTEEDVWRVLDDWENFEAYGEAMQPSNSGSPIFFEIYLSDQALTWIEDPDAAIDEDIAIVRPTYDSQDYTALASLTMMFKVPGSSPETDDWNWAKVSADGVEMDFGPDTNVSCSGCHAVVRDTNHWLLEVQVSD